VATVGILDSIELSNTLNGEVLLFGIATTGGEFTNVI